LAASWIAARICWNVPQRQILVIAALMSASVGSASPWKRGHGHDHPRLAVAALPDIVLDPGRLHLAQLPALGEAFNSGDFLAFDCGYRHHAGARCRAVDVHGARAALRDAAAIFRSGEADLLAQHPEQRGAGIDVDGGGFAVEGEAGHCVPPLLGAYGEKRF
jgi:hypothetical protein